MACTYLRSFLLACHSTRSLRLSNTNLLSAPFVRTSFGSRSFSIAAPKSGSLSLYLSVAVLSSPSNPLNASRLAPQIRFMLTIVCIYKLYLLTYLPSVF